MGISVFVRNGTGAKLITASKKSDIHVGTKFGKWTVVSGVYRKQHGSNPKRTRAHLTVKCDCGAERQVQVDTLVRGRSTQCRACGNASQDRSHRRTHGYSRHPIYGVYCQMIHRCYRPENNRFYLYGARGITVCDEWRENRVSFFEWAMAHGWEPGLEIDRKDNDGNYEPNNCHFVTRKANTRNRRTNRLFEIDGITKTLAEWCEIHDRTDGFVRKRLIRGLSIKRALGINS